MKAFKCQRTGKLFPGDYVENWGRKYGIGLGPKPVSECLLNQYDGNRPVKGANGSQAMFPVGNSFAGIQEVEVSEADMKKNSAILAIDDPQMSSRAQVMIERQIANKRIERNAIL